MHFIFKHALIFIFLSSSLIFHIRHFFYGLYFLPGSNFAPFEEVKVPVSNSAECFQKTAPWRILDDKGVAPFLNCPWGCVRYPGIRIPVRHCHYLVPFFGSNYPLNDFPKIWLYISATSMEVSDFFKTFFVWGMGILRVVFNIEAGKLLHKSTFIMTLIKQEKNCVHIISYFIHSGVFMSFYKIVYG